MKRNDKPIEIPLKKCQTYLLYIENLLQIWSYQAQHQ